MNNKFHGRWIGRNGPKVINWPKKTKINLKLNKKRMKLIKLTILLQVSLCGQRSPCI